MSAEDAFGRERQFPSQRRRVSAFLAGFGCTVSGDGVALPSTIDKDPSFEMLPLVMYNWRLWSGGKLDPRSQCVTGHQEHMADWLCLYWWP